MPDGISFVGVICIWGLRTKILAGLLSASWRIVIPGRGLRTSNSPPPAAFFYFFRILFEASFRGSFKIKNPACAG